MLTPDFDIIQAIRKLIPALPIPVGIFHVKAHQDQDQSFDDLSPYAQLNIMADHYAEHLHHCPSSTIGLFPTWIPGTIVGLFHNTNQITSNIPEYIRTAAHEPPMREYLIERSKMASSRDSIWTETTFDNIAWKHLGEALHHKSIGQRIQLSKYMNDMLPTAKRLQTINNKHDGCCFDCNQLWEDTNHVLCCPSENRETTRTEAFSVLRTHFQAQHTPTIVTNIICDSMQNWIERRRIAPPQWMTPTEPIMNAITIAFNSQKRIGWDQFLRGRLSLDWKNVISIYYGER